MGTGPGFILQREGQNKDYNITLSRPTAFVQAGETSFMQTESGVITAATKHIGTEGFSSEMSYATS